MFPKQPWRVRHTCRLCGNPNPKLVLSLAPTPPANAFCKTAEEARAQEKFPLYLVRCVACGHVQLPVVVDPEVLFGDYVYTTGSSPALVEHFSKFAKSVGESESMESGYTLARPGALVVDVGSNDGTLLKAFRDLWDCEILGVDPAKGIAARALADGVPTMPEFFTRELAARIREVQGPAALVTATNVFAHADDLGEIALAARDLLSSDGRFVFEVQYLVDLVDGGYFDMVYHEHLSYHHVAPLVPFFRRLGMTLVDVERVPTHGGSIRCTVRPGEHEPSPRVYEEFVAFEQFLLANPWPVMAERIRKAGAELRAFLDAEREAGRAVVGYGAPAKLTTLCHQFGITREDVSHIIDDSEWKQSLYAPGTAIQAVACIGYPADTILIFAWNYADAIAAKLRAGGFAGRIYSPLPTLKEHP